MKITEYFPKKIGPRAGDHANHVLLETSGQHLIAQ